MTALENARDMVEKLEAQLAHWKEVLARLEREEELKRKNDVISTGRF